MVTLFCLKNHNPNRIFGKIFCLRKPWGFHLSTSEGEGVKNTKNSVNVVYERPQRPKGNELSIMVAQICQNLEIQKLRIFNFWQIWATLLSILPPTLCFRSSTSSSTTSNCHCCGHYYSQMRTSLQTKKLVTK